MRSSGPTLPLLRPDAIGDDVEPGTALVGFGFRSWMNGLDGGDLESMESCWCTFAGAFGASSAKMVVNDLSCWVKSLRASAGRPLRTLSAHCPGFCQDECLAISMIAAAQNDVCPAMRACAFALLETNDVDLPVATGMQFADTLRQEGVILAPNQVVSAVSLVEAAPASTGGRLIH